MNLMRVSLLFCSIYGYIYNTLGISLGLSRPSGHSCKANIGGRSRQLWLQIWPYQSSEPQVCFQMMGELMSCWRPFELVAKFQFILAGH